MQTIYYFLPVIIILGIITSYEDLKYGKVKNRWITLGVLLSIILNVLIIIINGSNVNNKYYIDLIINILISLLISFAFFYFDIWSEGDGKLFLMYATLIPLTFYDNSYFQYFPSFALLVNIFLPYLIYSIIKAIFNPEKEMLIESLKEIFTKKFFFTLLNLFSLSWIIYQLLSLLGITNILLSIALTLIIYQYVIAFIEKKYEKITLYISIILGVARFLFDKTIYTISFWVYFILMMILFQIIFRSLLQKMVLKSSIKLKTRKEIKENDVLAYTLKKIKGVIMIEKDPEKQEKTKNIFLNQNTIFSKKEINMIKKQKTKFLIPIYQRIPFAHIIFIGVIITIILKGNILILITKLF